jgi:TRAP-type C4-dicarboxylate transport system permease small subunit
VRRDMPGVEPAIDRRPFKGIRALGRVCDGLFTGTGYLSGGLFVFMAFFITYDVLARKWGSYVDLPTTRVTDEISGYLLVLASTWGLAYTLKTAGHVRIDVLLPYMPQRLRAAMDFIAMICMGVFAGIFSWKIWGLVLDSLASGITSSTYLLTPLYIPQGILGVGFTLLTLAAVVSTLSMIAEWMLSDGYGGNPSENAAVPGRADAADPPTRPVDPSLR